MVSEKFNGRNVLNSWFVKDTLALKGLVIQNTYHPGSDGYIKLFKFRFPKLYKPHHTLHK